MLISKKALADSDVTPLVNTGKPAHATEITTIRNIPTSFIWDVGSKIK